MRAGTARSLDESLATRVSPTMILLHIVDTLSSNVLCIRCEHLCSVEETAFGQYLLAIDLSLARDSRDLIRSIKLRKNNESPRDVRKTICAGNVPREGFYSPL